MSFDSGKGSNKPGIGQNRHKKGHPSNSQDDPKGIQTEIADINQVATFDIANGGTELPKKNKQGQEPDGPIIAAKTTKSCRQRWNPGHEAAQDVCCRNLPLICFSRCFFEGAGWFFVNVSQAHDHRDQGRQACQQENQPWFKGTLGDAALKPAAEIDGSGIGNGQDAPLEVDEGPDVIEFPTLYDHQGVADHIDKGIGGKGQIEGDQVNPGNLKTAEGQEGIEGSEEHRQKGHEDIPRFSVISEDGKSI